MSLVPWMPAPAKMPIQRALIGLSGPGRMTFPARSPAQSLFGTCQDGFVLLVLDRVEPRGRLQAGLPDRDRIRLDPLQVAEQVSWKPEAIDRDERRVLLPELAPS